MGHAAALTRRQPIGSTGGGELLLFLCDSEARNHLAKLLPRSDVADADVVDLLHVEQGEALREELTVDHALAQARNYAESHAACELVERSANALEIVRFDMLETVAEHDPVDALARLLGAGGA